MKTLDHIELKTKVMEALGHEASVDLRFSGMKVQDGITTTIFGGHYALEPDYFTKSLTVKVYSGDDDNLLISINDCFRVVVR